MVYLFRLRFIYIEMSEPQEEIDLMKEAGDEMKGGEYGGEDLLNEGKLSL